MKILSWNVNGLRAIEKKGFRRWLLETQPDILAIQETKAHKEQLSDDLLHIDGYHSLLFALEKERDTAERHYIPRKSRIH